MKIAFLYERGEHWYLQPSSRTTKGLWVATPPVIQLDRDAPLECKGEAAMKVLNTSRASIPIPTDLEDVMAPLLETAKVRSYAAFMKHARCISMKLESREIKVIPQKKLARPKGALNSLPEKTIYLMEDAPPEEIGAALQEALRLCE
jgi:hypothetical protein